MQFIFHKNYNYLKANIFTISMILTYFFTISFEFRKVVEILKIDENTG